MKSLVLLLVLLCGVPAITAAAVVAVQDAGDNAAPQLAAAEAAQLPQAAALPEQQEENQLPLPVAEDVPMLQSVRGDFYGCPSGWVRYDDGCYRFEATRRSWASAQARCNSLRADLPSVHSREELYFLQRLTRQAGLSAAWIGGFFFQGWRWIDNSPFNYFTNPSTSEGTPSTPCLHLNTVGSWSNHNCGNTLAYICVRRSDDC